VSRCAAPASAREALELIRTGYGYLAAADPAVMATAAQASCLLALEQADAVSTAVRARVLGAFTAGGGCAEDADYSPAAWLMHRTRITRAAARFHRAWARRAAAHPEVAAALAEGYVLSESYARAICGWTGQLPQDCRQAADEILVTAARAGMDLPDLAELAAEMLARSAPPDDDPGGFDDRSVTVLTTFQGAGVLSGDLTPECAAVVTAVLDALSAPAGSDDDRTFKQRYHDALQEAMRRLLAAGLLPERAGQPVKAVMHVSLGELRGWDGDSLLEGEWAGGVQARWAAYRAGAWAGGSDGGAWLTGDAARAMTCDARMATYVDGDVDLGALEDLVRLCASLDRLDHLHRPQGPCEPLASRAVPGQPVPGEPMPVPAGLLSRQALQRAIIGKAVDLVSGPGGLASFLRTRELGAPLAGPSQPLDIGFSNTIPPGIRNAVIWRDKHCRWAGGCNQPAAACEVHHTKHKANGGKTSTKDCVLLCSYHHQVMIHRLGWTLILNPDGTTTVWNKNRTKTLHSHSPPAPAG
jgi:Domain of unknown function (DUF222)